MVPAVRPVIVRLVTLPASIVVDGLPDTVPVLDAVTGDVAFRVGVPRQGLRGQGRRARQHRQHREREQAQGGGNLEAGRGNHSRPEATRMPSTVCGRQCAPYKGFCLACASKCTCVHAAALTKIVGRCRFRRQLSHWSSGRDDGDCKSEGRAQDAPREPGAMCRARLPRGSSRLGQPRPGAVRAGRASTVRLPVDLARHGQARRLIGALDQHREPTAGGGRERLAPSGPRTANRRRPGTSRRLPDRPRTAA